VATILSIHAHPDDSEILAGGTLAALAGRGHNIVTVTFTPGDCGSRELGPEEIAAVRRREAAAAAGLIGASYYCLEMRDMAIFSDDPSRRRVTEALRQTRPDIVLAASPEDYLSDHETASVLVRDACFVAPAPNYATRALQPAAALGAIPHLYFMDPAGGVGRDNRVIEPGFVVDVSETFARKRDMLACHESQRNWLRAHHGTDDYLDMMELWTRRRGALAGLSHGEGFRAYHGHPYPESPLLEELLGGLCHPLRMLGGAVEPR
jgi:N-acetylglucosamine malate deacetylase 1